MNMRSLIKILLLSTAGLVAEETFAATVSEVTEPILTNASSSVSIIDTVSRVFEHTRAGNLEAAASEYAKYAMCPDALWFNILFAAQMIERLGVLNMAIEVFEWSKTHPKTRCFNDLADSEIVRLTKDQSEHIKLITKIICSTIAGDSNLLASFQAVISETLPEGFFFRTEDFKQKELNRILMGTSADKLKIFETLLQDLERKTPSIVKLIDAVKGYNGNVSHTPATDSDAPVDSIPGAHDIAASGVILNQMNTLRAIQGEVPDTEEAYARVISEVREFQSDPTTGDICRYIYRYGIFSISKNTEMEAIDNESDPAKGIRLSEILIRVWTFAESIADVENQKDLKTAICDEICQAAKDGRCLQAYTGNLIGVVFPYLDDLSEVPDPSSPPDPSPTAAIPLPAPSIVAAPSPTENKIRYQRMYLGLKETWKAVAGSNLQEFFFDRGVEGSELSSTAVLELMYGFLIEHPEIYIPDLENFGLFTIAAYDKAKSAVTIPQIPQLKNKLLNQSLAAFEKGQKLYATIVQVGGSRSGHYTLVVIENNGNVHMINTMGAHKGGAAEDPYVHIMPELVKALNTHKGTAPIVFTAASNVRTGIQDADAGSNSCGIYSFVYWAALMMTQDINAYKRVTAVAAEGYLGDYNGILKAAIHTKAMDAIVQVDDLSKANEFGIRYFKNPNAEVQTRFELDVRDRLQLKLIGLSS